MDYSLLDYFFWSKNLTISEPPTCLSKIGSTDHLPITIKIQGFKPINIREATIFTSKKLNSIDKQKQVFKLFLRMIFNKIDYEDYINKIELICHCTTYMRYKKITKYAEKVHELVKNNY